MLWCLISTILFDAYASKAKGATFKSPDGTQVIQIFTIGFVDDTSGSTNDFDSHALQSPDYYLNLDQKDTNSGMIY
jgi:hypothetical protein